MWSILGRSVLTHDDVRPHVDESLGGLVAHSGVAAGDDHHLHGRVKPSQGTGDKKKGKKQNKLV